MNLGGEERGVCVLFWYGLEVIVLIVAVGDGQRKSQSTSYCLRKCHHCTLWSIQEVKIPLHGGIMLESVRIQVLHCYNMRSVSGVNDTIDITLSVMYSF